MVDTYQLTTTFIAFYLGHGCAGLYGFTCCKWGAAATRTLYMRMMWLCSSPRCREIFYNYGNPWSIRWSYWAVNKFAESNVLPIQSGEMELANVQNILPCTLSDFPCKYLGLPLSLKSLTKEQLQPIVDCIADQLPGRKADLMTRAGRRVQIQFVLTGMCYLPDYGYWPPSLGN